MIHEFDALNPDDPKGPPIKVALNDGFPYWECICKKCGFVNGGHWLVPGGGPPIEYHDKCVECDGVTEWIKLD